MSIARNGRWWDELKNVSNSFFHQCEHKEPSLSFAQLQEFLLKPDVIRTYRSFLNTITNTKLSSRDLLSSYAFAYFDVESSLQDISRELLQALVYGNDISRVELLLNKYECLYIAWHEEDKISMLETLSRMYWEYEINFMLYKERLSEEEAEFYLDEKKKRQEECLSMMEGIDNLAYFYQYTPIFMDSQGSNLLLQILRKAFWSRLKNDLQQIPPKLEGLYSLFEEIDSHLQEICQRHARPTFIENYREIFNIEFFRQREASGLMTIDFWMPRCNHLYLLLTSLDSIARDTNHADAMQKLRENQTLEGILIFLEHFMTRLLEVLELYRHVFSQETKNTT